MKILLLFSFIFAFSLQNKFTISEFNILNPSDDIHTTQFPYLVPKFLSHIYRITSLIQSLNSIMADVMCIVEWNTNTLNPSYISDSEQLLILLDDSITNSELTPSQKSELHGLLEELKTELLINPENKDKHLKHIIQLENFLELIEENTKTKQLRKELLDRLLTIKVLPQLLMYQNNYSRDITLKYSGLSSTKGVIDQQIVFPGKTSDNKEFPSQGIMFIFDKNKFEIAGEKEVYLTLNSQNLPNSQNFMVQRLKHLESQKIFTFICSQFEPNYKGHIARNELNLEIIKYIEKDKSLQTSLNKDTNYVLMGDFNSEIREVSFNLNSKIIRLDQPEFPKSFEDSLSLFQASAIFDPKSFLPELDQRIIKQTKNIGLMQQAIQNYKGDNFPTLKPEIAKQEIDLFTQELNELKTELETITNNFQLSEIVWIEANNFKTVRKISLPEINSFEDLYYNAYINILTENIPQIEIDISTAVDKVYSEQATRTSSPAAFWDVINFEGSKKQEVEIQTLLAIVKTLQNEKPYLKINEREFPTELLLEKLLDFFMKAEKTDFILLSFDFTFKINRIASVENYQQNFESGIPNEKFGSDHFPSIVEIEIIDNVKFDVSNFSKEAIVNPRIEDFKKEVLSIEMPINLNM